MNTFTKTLVGTVAAGALAVSSTAPAYARDGEIGAGEIIAGALVIGGIAAIAASAGNKDSYSYDRAGYRDYPGNGRYGRGYGNPRQAVEQCVRAAERNASRYSRGRADVTDVRSVKNTSYGYRVKGRIAVNSSGHGWRKGDAVYGRGWNGDYRGWNSNLRGYDSGRFDCKVSGGRVVDLDYSGIRGL